MPHGIKIQGFSKLSREEKISIVSEYAVHPVEFAKEMFNNRLSGQKTSGQILNFTENAISDFWLPYSVAPNFLINGKEFIVPMVTEESSVIAAASSAAKFWWDHGGFITTARGLTKPGHIHFMWYGTSKSLNDFFNEIREGFTGSVKTITASMQMRGGGIESISLINLTRKLENYYKIEALFNTADSMGANFINSCLEKMAEYFISCAEARGLSHRLEIIMAILSNYTPQCLIKCRVSCKISDLTFSSNAMSGKEFARRFEIAVRIAQKDISRAVTHNKGIFNGIDAVVLATGNDYRAVEAAGHSWACRNGSYGSLSDITISNDQFVFWLEMPVVIGVKGGITNLHPMTKASLQLLGNPDAETLMSVAASAGLANHFSALRALITEGIQQGHMKLHLVNILDQLNAGNDEKKAAAEHFANKKITYSGVKEFLSRLRSN